MKSILLKLFDVGRDRQGTPRDRLSNGIVVACAVAAALVGTLLVACDGGGGDPVAISYVCENGVAIEGTTTASSAVGCQSCNVSFQLSGTAGAGTSCPAIMFDGSFSRVDSATSQFGVSETSVEGLAAIGNTLYMTGAGNNTLFRADPVPPTTP